MRSEALGWFQNGNEASSKSPLSLNRSDSRNVSSCDFYPKKILAQVKLERGAYMVQFVARDSNYGVGIASWT